MFLALSELDGPLARGLGTPELLGVGNALAWATAAGPQIRLAATASAAAVSSALRDGRLLGPVRSVDMVASLGDVGDGVVWSTAGPGAGRRSAPTPELAAQSTKAVTRPSGSSEPCRHR